MKTESGYSLLELLTCLLISAILSSIVIHEIINKNELIIKIKEAQNLLLTKNRLVSMLKSNGSWTAFDRAKIISKEKLIEIFPHLNKSSAKPYSSALSFLDFDSSFYLKPLDKKRYCLQLLNSEIIPSPTELKYLILSKTSWAEAELKLSKKKSTTCNPSYELKEQKHYSSPFNFDLNSINFTPSTEAPLLLPIRNSFSIYLDQNKTLRRIEHFSSNNQPIEYKIDRLTFKQNQSWILGQLQKNKAKQYFYLKNESYISSIELYVYLKDL